ncbi:MAG: threonine ammonia-lyase [Pseudomonadaceae bacterium]|nr:threonine ammonia-lyase [Pseudomonadaceae bacterium]
MPDSFCIDIADIEAARERIAGHVLVSSCERSATLSAIYGADVWLKFENEQFTSSFKERGALNRLSQLSPGERKRGVIAMSAGNHAQAVARHGERLGIPTTIVMPRTTPNAKVEATRVFGADIILHGIRFDETLAYTQALAQEKELTLVHPFDDPLVIAGQGTLGLELAEQIPDADVVLVPVGGGGMISGTAVALADRLPRAQVIGVQVERYSAMFAAFHGQKGEPVLGGTVAEGIAVKEPGANTSAIIRALVKDMLTVSEDRVEQAIFSLLEIEKTLCEGAGAVTLAALADNTKRFAGKTVVLVLSGGNIDMMILSSVLQRGLVRSHRLVRLAVEIPDVPGGLADLTTILAELDSNIVDIVHQRAFGGSSVRATLVEAVLQMRGEEQVDQVIEALNSKGYAARLDP